MDVENTIHFYIDTFNEYKFSIFNTDKTET